MGNERRSWLERFESAYPLLITGMLSAGNVVMTLTQTVIISFGLLFILFALMVVEEVGIQDGLGRIIASVPVAMFAASAIVVANLVIDLYIVYIEHKEGYKRPIGSQWSVRLWIENIGYRVGYGKKWKARRRSPALRFINARWLVTILIFMVALGGRMKISIETASHDANGHLVTAGESIHRLLYESSLTELMDWTIGTFFTMWAVLAVQNFTHYMALKVVDIQDELKLRERNDKAAATRERLRKEREARLSMPVSIQTDTRQTGSGYVRVSSAVEKARQWLTDNPDKVDMPVRDLADRIGVGKDSVAKARKELKR